MHETYQYSLFGSITDSSPCLPAPAESDQQGYGGYAHAAPKSRRTRGKRKHGQSPSSNGNAYVEQGGGRQAQTQNENTYSRLKRQQTSKNRQRNCTRTAENAAIYRRSRFEGVKVTICKLAFRISLLQAALPVRPNLANSYHTYARTPADPFHRKANTPHSTCASPLT